MKLNMTGSLFWRRTWILADRVCTVFSPNLSATFWHPTSLSSYWLTSFWSAPSSAGTLLSLLISYFLIIATQQSAHASPETAKTSVLHIKWNLKYPRQRKNILRKKEIRDKRVRQRKWTIALKIWTRDNGTAFLAFEGKGFRIFFHQISI